MAEVGLNTLRKLKLFTCPAPISYLPFLVLSWPPSITRVPHLVMLYVLNCRCSDKTVRLKKKDFCVHICLLARHLPPSPCGQPLFPYYLVLILIAFCILSPNFLWSDIHWMNCPLLWWKYLICMCSQIYWSLRNRRSAIVQYTFKRFVRLHFLSPTLPSLVKSSQLPSWFRRT